MQVRIYLALVLVVLAGSVRAELQSLFPGAQMAPDAVTQASLFTSPEANLGFFAPLPPRAEPPQPSMEPTQPVVATGTTPVSHLLTLIAQAEAGSAGYNAVQHGARIKPALPPTKMTLGDIYRWIDATPGQPHAIGRYQFIPQTLRRVAHVRGFGPDTPFSPAVQDALATVLLEDAGISAFQAGALGRRQFMHNLARIWAGLPLPNGRSYYEGYAGNSAAMSWAAFNGGMARIWPAEG